MPSSGNKKITVAILDTGFSRKVTVSNVLFKDFCGVSEVAEDLDGHGSHLSGILLRQSPQISLHVGRIMTHAYLMAHNPLIDAIYWAMEQQVDIILIAAGFSYDKEEIYKAVIAAIEANIIVIAAIGNKGASGENAGHFPARYSGVIAVGSVDARGEISDFSDQCPELDILAPGENIKSFYLNGEIVEGSGTSQAAANVAGAVANIIEAYKAKHMPYTTKSIIKLLQRTGGSTMPSSEFKIIDQEAALKAIRED